MTVAERRTREKESRRQQILQSAREIFLKKGFDGTTIEEIARHTELSKGAIYLYFPSKEEIYISLMEEGSGILFNMLKKAAEADLPADSLLRRLGQAYYRFYKAYPAYFRMMFLFLTSSEMLDKITSELHERCEECAKESLLLVSGVIQKGMEQGMFKPCNSWDMAILLWTSQNGIDPLTVM